MTAMVIIFSEGFRSLADMCEYLLSTTTGNECLIFIELTPFTTNHRKGSCEVVVKEHDDDDDDDDSYHRFIFYLLDCIPFCLMLCIFTSVPHLTPISLSQSTLPCFHSFFFCLPPHSMRKFSSSHSYSNLYFCILYPLINGIF